MARFSLPSKTSKKWIWIRDLLIVAVVFFAISEWQTRNMLPEGEMVSLHHLSMPTLEGEVSGIATSPEKYTLVYFFAPWCNVCRYSIGNLDFVDESKVSVARIALDYTSTDAVQQFVDETNIQGNVFLGSEMIKQNFNVPGYPSYYLLDGNMQIVDRAFGYTTTAKVKLKTWFNGPLTVQDDID